MRRLGWALFLVVLFGCRSRETSGPAPAVERSPASAPASHAAPAPPPVVDRAVAPWIIDPARLGEGLRDPFLPQVRPVDGGIPRHCGPVLLSEHSIDDLRLIAVVEGSGPDRAMLVDPAGTGTVVHRGDSVGRREIVQAGGEGTCLGWRVERIRRDEIVLVREDASGAATTRTLSLSAGLERKLTPATLKSAELATPRSDHHG